MTIQEIADANADAGRYFFSKATLKGFGQRLSDFEVMEDKSGRVWVFATSRKTNAPTGYTTFAEFNTETGHMRVVSRQNDAYWTRKAARAFVSDGE